MEAYTGFAKVYDMFMDNTPYGQWGDFISEQLKRYGIDEGLVLDLGCGTGKMTSYLAEKGYDMIGADGSEEMLEIALERSRDSGQDILFLNQDMRELELYGTVRAVVSTCDCMNYLLEEEDLAKVFSLVNNYLDPGGIFLFDVNTPYKYRELLCDNTIAENRENGSFIWENYYYEEEEVNEYDLTLFIPEEDGLYRKYCEKHYQRAYSLDKIQKLLEEAGLEFAGAFDDYTGHPPTDRSERICIIAKEKRK